VEKKSLVNVVLRAMFAVHQIANREIRSGKKGMSAKHVNVVQ
jgi:hypothetical protein